MPLYYFFMRIINSSSQFTTTTQKRHFTSLSQSHPFLSSPISSTYYPKKAPIFFTESLGLSRLQNIMKRSETFSILVLFAFWSLASLSGANLFAQPLTVPAVPVQTQARTCRLDLSAELFGGVNAACGRNLDRSRCCPVLAAWLFAAHARTALRVEASAPAAEPEEDLPMMPDDSQKCVDSMQASLASKNVHIPQPNASCDPILCFCGIRLHQISSLSCPAAFNISGHRKPEPTAAVKNLEKSCRNSSYAGCTKCLGALQKMKGNKTGGGSDNRLSKMFNRDCQLMGLTWLLAKNKTEYIPTVSAVLRAIMYSAHPPHQNTCSPDQENMPLAVDSLQFDEAHSSPSTTSSALVFCILPLIICVSLFLIA